MTDSKHQGHKLFVTACEVKNTEPVKSFELFNQSFKLGCSCAATNIGYSYMHGRGVAKDPTMAVHWYNIGVEKGQYTSMWNLAMCYESGKGVEKDEIKAGELYIQSYDHGYTEAKNKIYSDALYRQMYIHHSLINHIDKRIDALEQKMDERFEELKYTPGMAGAKQAEDEFNSLL